MEKDTFARFTAQEKAVAGLLTGGSLPSFKICTTKDTPKPFMSAKEYSDRRHDRMLFLMNRYVPNLMNAFKPAVDAWHKTMREKAAAKAEKTRLRNLTK